MAANAMGQRKGSIGLHRVYANAIAFTVYKPRGNGVPPFKPANALSGSLRGRAAIDVSILP
jgi:hypothetical protein